ADRRWHAADRTRARRPRQADGHRAARSGGGQGRSRDAQPRPGLRPPGGGAMDAHDASAQPFRPPVSSVLMLDFERLKSKLADYLKPEDLGRIEAAYHFSADAHLGQFRIS